MDTVLNLEHMIPSKDGPAPALLQLKINKGRQNVLWEIIGKYDEC